MTLDSQFGHEVILDFRIRAGERPAVEAALAEASAGRVVPELLGERLVGYDLRPIHTREEKEPE